MNDSFRFVSSVRALSPFAGWISEPFFCSFFVTPETGLLGHRAGREAVRGALRTPHHGQLPRPHLQPPGMREREGRRRPHQRTTPSRCRGSNFRRSEITMIGQFQQVATVTRVTDTLNSLNLTLPSLAFHLSFIWSNILAWWSCDWDRKWTTF